VCNEVLPGRARKSSKVAGYDQLGRSPIRKRLGKVIWPIKTI
jgi:hypothetical protein